MMSNAYIPYGGYWSSPFCRWQGGLAREHSMELAARTARRFFETRELSPDEIDGLILGITVPQKGSFYGAPWLAGMLGAPGVGGPTLAQACATSARMVATAGLEVASGQRSTLLLVACDRTSNGPHMVYPDPAGVGGRGTTEDPVWDNFQKDPWAGQAMLATAEKVAADHGFTREQQDALTLVRSVQYEAALANDRAFQKRYMIAADIPQGRKGFKQIEADEGIHPTTAEGLAALRPVLEGGTVTYGSQTHPADGNAGLLVCSQERATELSRDAAISIRLLGYGEARVGKAMMPTAPVPAARVALERAAVTFGELSAVKTHNPFAVNDLYFCKETGLQPKSINRYGSPLIYGHPQAPTGLRGIIELIEELVERGGGVGLFTGCAAGDTAMAVVLSVGR